MIRKHYPAWARRKRRGAPDTAIIDALATALVSADDSAVRAVLHRDVVLTIDSGGLLAPTASTSLEGRVATASALTALLAPGTAVSGASINGAAGLVLTRDESVVSAITGEMRSGMLSSIWVVCNPEKLRHWNR
jgi:RNA polymerase sigma-70 factor (ECF subfamily)